MGHDWGAAVADTVDQLHNANKQLASVTMAAVPVNFVHALLQHPSQARRCD